MNSVKIKNGQTNKLMSSQKKISEAVFPNNYNPSDIKYKYHLKDLTAPVKRRSKSRNNGCLLSRYKIRNNFIIQHKQ